MYCIPVTGNVIGLSYCQGYDARIDDGHPGDETVRMLVLSIACGLLLTGCARQSATQMLNTRPVGESSNTLARQSIASRTIATIVIHRATGKPLRKPGVF